MAKKVFITELIDEMAEITLSPAMWITAEVSVKDHVKVFVLKYFGAGDYDADNLLDFFDYILDHYEEGVEITITWSFVVEIEIGLTSEDDTYTCPDCKTYADVSISQKYILD